MDGNNDLQIEDAEVPYFGALSQDMMNKGHSNVSHIGEVRPHGNDASNEDVKKHLILALWT